MAINRQHSFGLLMGLLTLPACASVPGSNQTEPSPPSQVFTDRLPPQNLAPGKCGLFIWAGGERQKFIGFETEGEIKLILGGETLEGRRVFETEESEFERSYEVKPFEGALKEVSLSLIEDREIAEGFRYSGRLKSQTDAGWERLTPVVALYSCVSQY